MSANQKLNSQARLALAQAVDILNTIPTDSMESVQIRVCEAVGICELFQQHYEDFNPGFFLDACDIDHFVALSDGDEARRLCDEADGID